MRTMIALALMAAPAMAETTAYSDHKGVLIFSDAPCTAVISAIDSEPPAFPNEAQHFFYGSRSWYQNYGEWGATQGMAWGFVLGFDTANGGLHTDTETTLQRLRAACEETPDRTALDILTSFIR